MFKNIEEAFKILEQDNDGFPFEAIDYLYRHEPDDRIYNKICYHLSRVYEEKLTDFNPTHIPELRTILWYAIVAENHHDEKLADLIIYLISNHEFENVDLYSQISYLIQMLSKKYPDTVAPKVIKTIDVLTDKYNDLSYNFLFSAVYYADLSKYKETFLRILSKDVFKWYTSYVDTISIMQIKEAIPILENKLKTCEYGKEISDIDFDYNEIKNNIKEIKTGQFKYPEIAKPHLEYRGNWYEYYKEQEKWMLGS